MRGQPPACAAWAAKDANILATMLTHGITRLLTFNTADFQRFAGLIALVVPSCRCMTRRAGAST